MTQKLNLKPWIKFSSDVLFIDPKHINDSNPLKCKHDFLNK